MNQNIQYITLLTATLGLLTGCAASQRQAERVVTVTPDFCRLTPDSVNEVRIDMVFHVPENSLSRRSRLVITPQLIKDGVVLQEYTPLVLDAPVYSKKVNRKQILEDYIDPHADKAVKADKASRAFDLPWKDTLQLLDQAVEGRFIAVISTDGCGECTGIDTINLASISLPVPVSKEEPAMELAWIEPEFVIRPKVMEGKGIANLQFGINKSDIDLAIGNNRKELEEMLHTLTPVLGDTLATVSSLTITGMASADGSLAFNTTLARNRATAARQWLIGRLNINPDIQRLISIDSRPEGWEPVLLAMLADGDPDSEAVKGILEKYNDSNDDVQEYHIRRLSCWNRIKNDYLQNARKVEYVYSYTLKSFTSDAELLEMYRKRPDAFNEEELLRVAALTTSDSGKKEVYQTILKYFPHSQTAANNLAVLYLCEGKMKEAQKVLGVSEKLIIKKTK